MRSTSPPSFSRTILLVLSLFVWGEGLVSPDETQAGDEKGYRLTPDRIVVDQAEHWQAWTYPRHAVEIDSSPHEVHPRYIRKGLNAVEDLDRFQIKIGDDQAYTNLLRELKRENQPVPLNIRTGPAFAGSVPILHLKADPDKGIEVGDPVLWYFYHGGIRLVPNHPETAVHILDGDPRTYWEPDWVVSPEEYEALADVDKGPIYYFVTAASGEERRVSRITYEQASPAQRRIQYHSRSLQDWYVEVDLGRVVPVSRIVLRFVDAEVGEPFRQFRLLATPSQDRNAPLSLLGRMDVPNEDQRGVEFALDSEGEGHYEPIHRLRIAVTASQFDRFQKVSEPEYEKLSLSEQGGIDYYVRIALGGEIKRDEETYYQVSSERQGRRIFYRRERPRLADIEVWSQGDNIALGTIEGGGSLAIEMASYNHFYSNQQADRALDGCYDTGFSLPTSSGSQEKDLGIDFEDRMAKLDLGAVFWIDYIRTLGCCYGNDLDVRLSDGSRQTNGELVWTPLPPRRQEDARAQDARHFEWAFSHPMRARFLTFQWFLDLKDALALTGKDREIKEMELFGEGVVSEILLSSPLMEVPESVILGTVEWEADIPDSRLTKIEIRTRTGDQLTEETTYYSSGGEEILASAYQRLPAGLKGPVVTKRAPGSGWSPWSPPYRHSGESVLSPSPRKYLQIQVKLRSDSPELAPAIRSLQVGFQPPVAHQVRAEIWPDQVPLGILQTFTLFLNPTFVAARPDGPPSTRFDELRLDASPMEAIRLMDVCLGSEDAFRQDTAPCFREIGWRAEPGAEEGAWFTDGAGRPFQALLDLDSGDTLRAWEGAVADLEGVTAGPVLHLQFPRKIALLPEGTEERSYNRVILDERDQVPVDEDGRWLNEILYRTLPAEQQGRRLYFAITGRAVDGTAIQDSVSQGEYWGLPDSLQGEIRYFRTGIGGEFPFDRSGARLTEEAYARLDPAEQGTVLAPGQLVRVRFQGEVVLHGTTVEAAIRDGATSAVWQPVDAGEATALTPGKGLSIAVPFSRRILHHVRIAPNPFTPNGDGINDRTEIRFDLGKLNQARAIQVAIYDLGGRRIWQEKQEGYGSPVFAWDGRDDAGARVVPGLYVCQVSVAVDADEATGTTVVRVIAVVY